VTRARPASSVRRHHAAGARGVALWVRSVALRGRGRSAVLSSLSCRNQHCNATDGQVPPDDHTNLICTIVSNICTSNIYIYIYIYCRCRYYLLCCSFVGLSTGCSPLFLRLR
jgi:hypothetical protein